MFYKPYAFLTALLVASLASYGQQATDDCSCCTIGHKQFDFWIGDWLVYDTLGTQVGSNNILKIQNGCVLQENWISPQMTGTSYNYYDATDDTWNQLWLDNTGGKLILKGKYQNGDMVLKSEILEGKKGPYYNQITWRIIEDENVLQLWEIYDKKDNLLATAFHGIYKKK